MRDYQKLDVWKKSHLMVLHIYKVVLPSFPSHEKYDLHSQVKTAAYSVPLNIVEGAGRRTEKDFAHFLDMALGSVQKMDRKIGDGKWEMAGEVKAMLIGLIKHLRP